MNRKDLITLGGAAAAVGIAGIADVADLAVPVRFGSAAVALAVLAMLIGHSTEQVGHRLSAGATGVLQSAVGNLPELFVCIFSLRAGLVDVVRRSEEHTSELQPRFGISYAV